MNILMALGNGVCVTAKLFVVPITPRVGTQVLNIVKITAKIGLGFWDSNAQLL
jgi:hypothetical protein